MNASIVVASHLFEKLSRRAAETRKTVDELANDLLQEGLQPTGHPYVIRREGFRGGRPILRGASIPVWLIAAMWKSGDTIDEISQAYPHAPLAAIFDAISYYLDHREEIESQIAENRIERVLKDTGATMTDDGVIKLPNG